ncbi:MAG: hypothetical protein A3A82_00245 [Candidatus Pacebacteria bacterium RIFCSPLOWO2_01_FULL_47_12]|nr:MAG: hypothetical protein A3A82_00245 [Candidatus Pacebacteria bacterium RIFCSPLOWO2_01_FULL_47_12]
MPALVTQATSDQPEVVFFTDASASTKQIVAALTAQGVTVSCFEQSRLSDERVLTLCQAAYRVIFWFDPTRDNSLEAVAHHLGSLTQLQFLIPLITPCFTPAPQLKLWQETSRRQAAFLVQLNTLFPQTQCIFLRDILEGEKSSPLTQVFIQSPQAELLCPELLITPTALRPALERAQHFVFHPSRMSRVIQGAEIACVDLVSRAKTLYEQLHQHTWSLASAAVETTTPIPFYVSTEVVELSLAKHLAAYVKNLPSPQRWLPLFALPAVQTEEHIEQLTPVVVSQPSTPPKTPQVATDILTDITKLFSNSFYEHKTTRTKKIDQVATKIIKKKTKNTVLFLLGLISTGITLGILFLATFFWLSVSLTQRAVLAVLPSLLTEELEQSPQNSWQQRWHALLTIQADSYGSLLDIPIISKAEKIISLAEALRAYGEILPQARQTEQTLVQHVFGQTDSDIGLLAQNATTQSQSAYELLATLESQLTNVLTDSENDQALQASLSNKLVELRSGVALGQQIIPLLPLLGGVANKQTYALVFQNSQELRPTGGFIQSMAFITLAQGSVIDVQTIGSFELDQGITGVVAPPQDIERLLGEKNWYARDANWDPDFPTTATTLRWFVDRSRNVQLAGVLAIDTQGLGSIIEALGPIDLPEYNEVVTHKNLFERLEYHSEAVLVPESGAKDYSAVLLDRVLQKLLATPVEKFPTLLQNTRLAADQQHLLFAFTDESSQSAFQVLGWSGSILYPPCPPQLAADQCVVEPLYQVEANIGVNKANYYLNRNITHTISLSAAAAQHTRTVEYQNTAQSGSWPKGAYRAFVRYYLATNSTFDQLLVNGAPISVQDLSLTTEHNRTVVGATITVPVGATLTTQLKYATPLSLTTGSSAYLFFNQKQPGTNAAPLAVTLTYPPELQPEKIAPQAEITDTTINFSDKEEKNRMYGAKFF